MQTVGAQWFLVDRGASATVIALVQTAGLAPGLLLSLPAGVLADLLDRRRLLIATSVYSLVVSTAWPTPTVVFDVEPADGPILVTVRWSVLPGHEREFVAATRSVGRARRRTGAYRWGLFRQGDEPDTVLEQFMVRSWSEYETRARSRWTASDHAAVETAMSHSVPGSVIQRPFLAIGDDRTYAAPTTDSMASRP